MVGCCVPNCFRSQNNTKFHGFPKDENTYKLWLEAVSRADLMAKEKAKVRYSYRVCSNHFSDKMKFPENRNRTNLIFGAVPDINLPGHSHGKKPLMLDKNSPYIENVQDENCTEIATAPPKRAAPYLCEIKVFNHETNQNEEMCRICFHPVKPSEGSIFYADNKENEDVKIKTILMRHLPTLNFQIVGRSVICLKCVQVLEAYEKLIEMFQATEIKINKLKSEMDNHKNKGKILTIIEDSMIEINGEVSPVPNVESTVRLLKYFVKKERNLLCETCGEKCNNFQALSKHSRKHRQDKLREKRIEEEALQAKAPKLCEKCGITLENVAEFKKHALKHSPISCPHCSKVFYHKTNLYSHLRCIHERRYKQCQCHICGKHFTSSSNLAQHVQTHGPKTFVCEECEKSFCTKRRLAQHKIIHGGEVFVCQICNKKLKYRHSWEKHLRLVHFQEGDIKCEPCGKLFWKKHDYKQHMLKKHGVPIPPRRKAIA